MTKKTMLKWLSVMMVALVVPFVVLNALTASNDDSGVEASYAPYQIPNGGFESGNLDGWKAYRIWKNESGMAAFDSSLIHNGTYFDNYPYNRDGNYQLGITSGSVTWDQSTERMGYLRSTDFILGGSGWISFKLGGGKYNEFAHVSIRETGTNVEVARFGNRWFNNTDRASAVFGSGISNAEAFLFPYYFDLSSVSDLGDSLYILLCDTAAYDWSILSADSFVTYYPTESEPTPSADEIAVNILPSVLGIDTAANSIPNGYFDSNYDGWQISGEGWGYHGDHYMRSNTLHGDGGMGILRSTAFTVSTDKYIRFDWAGGLKFDKQIFISVKEVNTNIEKIRFVRRDNLSGKEGENFDNHMLNLSSLDSAKKYYLEFADARTGGWGISYVDAIRIVAETEWNSVASGDRAIMISDLPLLFDLDYQQQSVSFAQYFLEQTGPICVAMTGDFSSVWSTMATEYASLSDDAKDYFTASGTSENTIVAARERYLFIIGKYASLDKFVVDSLDNVYQGASDLIGYNISNNSKIILVAVTVVFIASAGLFFIFSRRHKEIV
ncbi:MAG: hypothetical protein WCX85_00565 [Bacilli bacterium]|nr:hypothetical protein [Bacilli bacterium]